MTVSSELHAKVLKRDGRCFLARTNGSHRCQDQWGFFHAVDDLSKLTVDHVHLVPGGVRGKRAPDDEQHLVAMCAYANICGPSRAIREAERAYLEGIYGPLERS